MVRSQNDIFQKNIMHKHLRLLVVALSFWMPAALAWGASETPAPANSSFIDDQG